MIEAGVCALYDKRKGTHPKDVLRSTSNRHSLSSRRRKRPPPTFPYRPDLHFPPSPLDCYTHAHSLSTDTLGGIINMSSLSRRACFKCGNVGHYAGESRPLLVVCALYCPERWMVRRALEHGTDTDQQRCAHRPRGSATTASSLATSPTVAPTRVLPRQSSATTARALDTSRPTAQLLG